MQNKHIILITLLSILFLISGLAKNVAVLVGINEYRYLPHLKYAEKDAEDLKEVLENAGFLTYLLTGNRIGREDILEELKYQADRSSYSDTLLFFFSGHGIGGSTEDEKGLLTRYSDIDGQTAKISHSDLKETLGQFRGKKIIVIDACTQGYETKNLARNQTLQNMANFLLFSSASNQQSYDGFKVNNIHVDNGIAAYFFKKAVEGEADYNSDNTISAGELYEYMTKEAQVVAHHYNQNMEPYKKTENDQLIFLGESLEKQQKGTLVVESIPSGAEIWIDGKEYGQTPKTFPADPGNYEVQLRKSSYEIYKEMVYITSETTTTVNASWEENIINAYPSGSLIPEQVLVKAGTFKMGNTRGDSEGKESEMPVHPVELTYDYYIGKYELTFNQYDLYCEITGISLKDDKDFGRGDKAAIYISWWDAIDYCNWLSEKEGLAKAYDSDGSLLDKNGKKTTDITQVQGYRLPTEAEWEYAARGGHQSTEDYKYPGSNNVEEVAWYRHNCDSVLQEVGTKKPNELGLYDMSGNVWEWCHDWYGSYSDESVINPIGQESGTTRAVRSSSYRSYPGSCRLPYRYGNEPGGAIPEDSFDNFGFRIARTNNETD